MMATHYFADVFQSLDDGRYFVKANVAGISHRQEAASSRQTRTSPSITEATHVVAYDLVEDYDLSDYVKVDAIMEQYLGGVRAIRETTWLFNNLP